MSRIHLHGKWTRNQPNNKNSIHENSWWPSKKYMNKHSLLTPLSLFPPNSSQFLYNTKSPSFPNTHIKIQPNLFSTTQGLFVSQPTPHCPTSYLIRENPKKKKEQKKIKFGWSPAKTFFLYLHYRWWISNPLASPIWKLFSLWLLKSLACGCWKVLLHF